MTTHTSACSVDVSSEQRSVSGFQNLNYRKWFSSTFLIIGVLGATTRYSMPRTVLATMAMHLGGELVEEFPPFLVTCDDGVAIVLTIRVGEEYSGSAFFLPAEKLSRIDPSLALLWERSEKGQTVRDFFSGTDFKLPDTAPSIPRAVEASWKFSYC